jgi:hypothetical protein
MMWASKFVWHFIWLLDFRTILIQYSDIELLYFAYIYMNYGQISIAETLLSEMDTKHYKMIGPPSKKR